MGFRGCLKFICKRLLEVTVVLLLLTFIPNLPPKANISEPYRVTPSKPLTGQLALNNKLDEVELWHKGDLLGPEAFAHYNGELYTSVHGGDIVKLTGNHITPIVKIGKPCQFYHEEHICGRPLGLQFDQRGNLYAADPYYGIFKINVKTGGMERLVSVDEEINGKKSKLPNSIAVASNGDIYWTDSSTQFTLQDGIFDMLADGSGRLVHYDSKTKRNTVLLDKLHFANGIALSEDEDFVIVAETKRNCIHRYYLKGAKKGTTDLFIDGLPGLPDNLKSDGKGGFLVPLVIAADADHPQLLQVFAEYPLVRKMAARLLGVTELLFKTVNNVYPTEFAARSIHYIGHFGAGTSLIMPARVTVLRVSKTGEIISSLHTVNKKISGISESHIFKDHLYLGSPFNDYIGRISLAKVGWEDLAHTVTKREAPATPPPTTTTSKPATTTTTPKPTTTTPKPTTTTPKPTTTTPKPTTTTPKPTQAPTTPPPTAKPQTPPKPQATVPPTPQQAPPPTPAPQAKQVPTQKQTVKDQAKAVPVK